MRTETHYLGDCDEIEVTVFINVDGAVQGIKEVFNHVKMIFEKIDLTRMVEQSTFATNVLIARVEEKREIEGLLPVRDMLDDYKERRVM